MEIWEAVEGFPNYEVSNQGRVRSLCQEEPFVLKPNIVRGYYRVSLYRKGYLVHRLIAKAFVPNPDKKPEVDHINRNKLDNRLENLRWVSKSEQNLNREFPPNKGTGERNIHLVKDWFQVSIKRNGKYVFSKFYKTLEEAVNARNEFLKIISED